MDEARRQQHDRDRAIAESNRRREAERRALDVASFRSALERHGIAWPGDDGVTHAARRRAGRPDIIVPVGAYMFAWNVGANQLMFQVPPDDQPDGAEAVWVACSPPNADYPLAWLAETWDRGQEKIAEAHRRRAEYEARQRARAEEPTPEPSGPEPWTIARESPMGQLIAGLVDVIDAAGGHGQLW